MIIYDVSEIVKAEIAILLRCIYIIHQRIFISAMTCSKSPKTPCWLWDYKSEVFVYLKIEW